MNFIKNSKAITLIALVITIIVLLILAGVSLNLILGNQGILNQATNAVDEYKKANIAEEIELAKANLSMAYYSNEDIEPGESLNDYILRKLNGYTLPSGATLSKTENGNFAHTDKLGNATDITIDSSLNVGIGNTEQNQTPVPPPEEPVEPTEDTLAPKDFTVSVSNVTMTSLKINAETEDAAATMGSQFVWISVPEDGYVQGENGAVNDVA